MDEIEKFVLFLKGKLTKKEINLVKFIYDTNLLTYSMINETIVENDKEITRPTNVLDLSYLKLCAKNFEDSDNLLEKIFLTYIGYTLNEYRNTWRLNLNNLETSLKAKCTYCSVQCNSCPFKLAAYINKCANDNKFNHRQLYDMLVDEKERVYEKNEHLIDSVANTVNEHITNSVDIVGAEMMLFSNCVTIENVSNEKISYKYLDFNVKNNSFFNNLNDYFSNKGIEDTFDLKEIKFKENDSYIFDKSPIEIAVYIKYLCMQNNLSEQDVLNKILDKRNFKESEFRISYYNQYVHEVQELDCSDREKEEIISILTYIRNYYFNEDLPYIHFNIALYTKNNIISDKVINIINKYARAFNYITNKPTLWVDTEMLVKRTKDSSDMIMQVESMYAKNDLLIFENLGKTKNLNEYRLEGLLTAIEKFNSRNQKSISIFVECEDIFKEVTQKHPTIESSVINKKIYIDGFNVQLIKEKVIQKLQNIMKPNKEFIEDLEKYIQSTYNPDTMDEYTYIDKLYNEIVFNKFKILNVTNSFDKSNLPKKDDAREIDEIMKDINSLVGISEVKANINELLKYLEYSKKIDTDGFVNLNMVFKGNSGTGKTTIARLLAELLYKLGFVRENKIIEVSSKDLIGTHLGETAPKTQAVIDSALDGVLFIDEAYAIMASRGGSNSNYPAECMATICKAIDLYKDRLVIIFAGYTREMNDFINANQGLMSRIGYELEFPDFSQKELIQIFEDEVKGNEFTLEDGVITKIEEIITKNKIGRNFGNARFVINLFDRLVVTHAANCTDDNELKTITNKDVDAYNETKKDKSRTVNEILKELNSLIGLKKVKETIDGFVSVIELNKKLNRVPTFNMHMIFKGNAGTGKTTVARLLAEIYYNLGYIKNNKLVEVQSQDLIGEFLGQTGPKTQAVIDSAVDGVLFIDEAYAIMEHNGTNASYSAECVATLLKAMEDYKGRLIIIFAGYTEEMRKFRDLNPGLKSRVGYEIDFEDYSIEELLEIYDKKVKERGFKSSKEARKKVENILRKAKDVENFGNGRFVENIVQKIIVEHARNTREVTDMERLLTFEEEDVSEIKAEESKKRIGF